jgi:prevent-host-death family protein
MDARLSNALPAAEAKARLSELLDRTERGEQVTITRHGKAIARLVPVDDHASEEERKAYMRGWLAIRNGKKIIRGQDVPLKDEIVRGRR